MRQEDYLLREIEKIGSILKAISNLLTGKNIETAIQVLSQFEVAKGMLDEAGFNTGILLSLNDAETKEYLHEFKGLKGGNVELLADVLYELGLARDSDRSMEYLGKALFIYNLCNSTDKTYSMERESKILAIRKALDII